MSERIKATVPVFVFLEREGKVYLQRRYNTGYLDGWYEPIAGKVDTGESPQQAARREAQEEAGVMVDEADLKLFHAYLNNDNLGHPWLGLMFRAARWEGEPTITEPQKCDHSGWFSMDTLPESVIPYVRDGLAQLACDATIEISYYPPGSMPQ